MCLFCLNILDLRCMLGQSNMSYTGFLFLISKKVLFWWGLLFPVLSVSIFCVYCVYICCFHFVPFICKQVVRHRSSFITTAGGAVELQHYFICSRPLGAYGWRLSCTSTFCSGSHSSFPSCANFSV
ncbi:hypothetical protein ABZP36_005055 [Zizania latifolia]